MIGYQFSDFVALPGKLDVVEHRQDFAGHRALQLHPTLAAAVALALREPLGARQLIDANEHGVQSGFASKFKTLLQNLLG